MEGGHLDVFTKSVSQILSDDSRECSSEYRLWSDVLLFHQSLEATLEASGLPRPRTRNYTDYWRVGLNQFRN